ncbi:MAG: S-layer homology domain-containing protein [Sedimentibacter sp.]|uniref:S-layer homology domain-containing protein n=1 Tax=Sedimentibacter sp. TaxID=1960295 RepID=UPI0031588D13
MLKKTKLISLVLAIALLLSQVTAIAATDSYAVEIAVAGTSTTLLLSLGDLKEMPAAAQIEQEYIYNSKTGEKTAQVKGVSLEYVLKEKAGVIADNATVIFEASDGYAIEPQSLSDIFNDDLDYVLAYEVNGEAIDNDGIADNEEITVYRKVKEAGEFGTVFKMVNKITVGEATASDDGSAALTGGTAHTPDSANEKSFTDISDEYKYAETAIYDLEGRGIIDGIGGGLFAPQNEFTREQFCKIAVMALGLENKEYSGAFSDLSKDRWSAPYVQAAVEAGLFKGYEDGTFRPEKTITRQEMAVVAANAAVATQKVTKEKLAKFVMEKSAYLDKTEVAEWAANAVAWLEAQGAFIGVAGDSFEPVKVVNRAEAAVVVFNTLFAQ